MSTQAIIKTKGDAGWGLWLGLLFMGTLCVLVLRLAVVNGYLQIFPLIFGAFFGAFAVPCLWALVFMDNFYELFEDRLIVYSYLWLPIKTIFIGDIIRWEEIEDGAKFKFLTVFTSTRKYNIDSCDDNYEEVKKYLTSGKSIGRYIKEEKKEEEGK